MVRIQACGVCHTDLHYREGGINDEFPFLLGHEAAVVVVSVGEGVTDVEPGDFVILNWRAVRGNCRACLRGRPLHAPDLPAGDRVVHDVPSGPEPECLGAATREVRDGLPRCRFGHRAADDGVHTVGADDDVGLDPAAVREAAVRVRVRLDGGAPYYLQSGRGM